MRRHAVLHVFKQYRKQKVTSLFVYSHPIKNFKKTTYYKEYKQKITKIYFKPICFYLKYINISMVRIAIYSTI